MAGLRARITYANVAATLALLAAIGGGIAVAGRKSGSDAKPAVVLAASAKLESGVPGGASKKLLTVPKIGRFTASRGEFGPSGGITYKNTTNTSFELNWVGGNLNSFEAFTGNAVVEPGETHFFGNTGQYLTFRVAIQPTNANRATPQANVNLTTNAETHRVFVVSAKP